MENITVNMENLTEEERKQLLALVEKGNKSKSKVWKPKVGETYFFVSSYGETRAESWDNDEFDNGTYDFCNCYKTREQAEFSLKKRKVEAELKRFADEHNDGDIDWNKEVPKYYILYCHRDDSIGVGDFTYIKENTVYFTSKEIAKKAVQEIGEERLKKYYFEV